MKKRILAMVAAVALLSLGFYYQGIHLGPANPQVKGTLAPANGGTGSSSVPGVGKVPIGDGTNYIPGDPIVSGPAAEGATPANNPVWVAGKGADGFIHSFRVANDGTLRTDPTGTTTQPVSGTVTATGPLTDTQLRATPVPVSGTVTTTPPSNASTNVTQFGGSAVVTGTGAGGAGIQRVTVSNDSSLAANQSVNVNQVAGAAPSATNALPVRQSDGTNLKVYDPCEMKANVFVRVSQTANTQIVTGTASNKLYICSIFLNTAGANNVALVEGTGTVCATGIAGVSTAGTTAATGFNFLAGGGMTGGNGKGSIMQTAVNANNLCLLQSAAVQLTAVIGYVVAP